MVGGFDQKDPNRAKDLIVEINTASIYTLWSNKDRRFHKKNFELLNAFSNFDFTFAMYFYLKACSVI
jgi:hypothetical protein